ncbi:MAG: alpha/beta hydrolase family protein [Mycobacteriales bacterium]
MFPTLEVIDTPVGPARVTREGPEGAGVLVLGHGAGGPGGGIETPDLLAARDAALAAGLAVVRVEQPWRVRGRRVAEPPARLDEAWRAVLAALARIAPERDGPLVVGGRSSGARVACRTATKVGATAVLALAFPLRPPGRPDRSRLPELLLPDLPRLVVQGDRDAFGRPGAAPGLDVHLVRGADHGFALRRRDGRSDAEVAAEVRDVVRQWLSLLITRGRSPAHGQTLT